MAELARYFEKKAALKAFVERTIIYPFTVLLVGLAVLLLFVLVVLPTIGSIYGALHVPAGTTLTVMLDLQKVILQWWYVIVPLVLLYAYHNSWFRSASCLTRMKSRMVKARSELPP